MFDFRGLYIKDNTEIEDEKNIMLQFEYLKSYDPLVRILIWIEHEINTYKFGNDCKGYFFQCTEQFIKKHYDNKYGTIDSNWDQRLSLGIVINLGLLQPLHSNEIQFINICVMKSVKQDKIMQKFKSLSISSMNM